MMESEGHNGFCVSNEDAMSCVPDSLYMFLRLLYGGQNVFDEYNGEDEQEQLQMQILSVAQDLVYGISGGKKWTSKHIGLS